MTIYIATMLEFVCAEEHCDHHYALASCDPRLSFVEGLVHSIDCMHIPFQACTVNIRIILL